MWWLFLYLLTIMTVAVVSTRRGDEFRSRRVDYFHHALPCVRMQGSCACTAAVSPPHSDITKHYKFECPSGTSFIIRKKSSLSKVVKPNYSTERKLWTKISGVRSVVETRSQQQIGTKKSRESFEIDDFVVRRETLFVKVKNRHFRRAKCLNKRRVRHLEY